MVATYKDGKQEGLQTAWYENGQKAGEMEFKDGEQAGMLPHVRPKPRSKISRIQAITSGSRECLASGQSGETIGRFRLALQVVECFVYRGSEQDEFLGWHAHGQPVEPHGDVETFAGDSPDVPERHENLTAKARVIGSR